MNRFESKKNVKLALEAYALLIQSKASTDPALKDVRLVLAGKEAPRRNHPTSVLTLTNVPVTGGYDPRLPDNVETLTSLISTAQARSLTWHVVANGTHPLPPVGLAGASPSNTPEVTFLLNFTTPQRQYLLRSPNTLCLLYTPGNEHFGIGPVEAMACGLPVVACPTGGPTETIVDITTTSAGAGTGWLRSPVAAEWADTLAEIVHLPRADREALSARAKARVMENFGMDEMGVRFERALYEAHGMGPVEDSPVRWSDFAGAAIVGLCLGLWWYLAGEDSLGTIPAVVLTVVGLGSAIRGTIKAYRVNE